MAEYFHADFIEKNIRTFPGSQYLLESFSELEGRIGKIPESFPLSIWLTNFLVKKECRQELHIPENPETEAIYWLGFSPSDSYELKDSLLVRITDRPQSFFGILDNPQIEDIVKELRKVYDGRPLERRLEKIRIPVRDFALHKSFTGGIQEINIAIINPREPNNIAQGFEAVFRKYGAIESMVQNGYQTLYNKVQGEIVTMHNL